MKTILFIGQAPARPSSKHEIPGSYLHKWLHSIGINDEKITNYCHFYALTDTFPGATKAGHTPPTKEQIAAYQPTLEEAIRSLNPDIIVPVGKMAIHTITNKKDVLLEETIGQVFTINPFNVLENPIVCISLSHPSGRSSWNHTHKELVEQALQLLKTEAART